MKKRLLVTFATLCVVVLISYGGSQLYSLAYSKGETAGYASGYTAGQEVGYQAGRQDGYDVGRQDGYSLGEREGYDAGYRVGREDGYAEGMEAGLGHGYTLRDPTYEQTVEFLREDKTNEHEYIEDVYVCSHFARDVCNNAEQQGLRCALTVINHAEGTHTIVAFDTIDEGLVFYEPQSDERVRPAVGKRYYQCVEPRPGYYYPPPPYDDTIRDILVIW